jgi:hypothetical protein
VTVYEQVRRMTELCRQANTAKEAEARVSKEFPDMDLRVLRVMAPYHYKFKVKS